MRPLFRSTLEKYNELAQATHEGGGDHALLEAAKQWHVQQEAKRWGTSHETQEHVFKIQEQKQRTIQKIHALFKRIDQNEVVQWQENPQRLYPVWQEGPHLFSRAVNGRSIPISEGAILTDGAWGTSYRLDATVSKHLRKQYIFESAKAELHQAMNEQIAMTGKASSQTESGPRGMYNSFLRKGLQEHGHIAELFVRTFLKKLIINHGLKIKILDGDIHQDAEQKIDFIIKRLNQERGVHVEEEGVQDTYEIVGVQLATGKKPHKQTALNAMKPLVKQTDNIQDILLIKVGRGIMLKAMHLWKEQGYPPGGPDLFIPRDKKERLFRRLLHGIISPSTIDKAWQRISRTLDHEPTRS